MKDEHPGLPRWIEVRTPDTRTRRYLDFANLPVPEHSTVTALAQMYAQALLELEAHLVEQAILQGHNRFEVQVEGHPTSLRTVPLWRFAFQSRLRVEWARWKHRHPDAGRKLLEAMAWSGTVWSAAVVPPRRWSR